MVILDKVRWGVVMQEFEMYVWSLGLILDNVNWAVIPTLAFLRWEVVMWVLLNAVM